MVRLTWRGNIRAQRQADRAFAKLKPKKKKRKRSRKARRGKHKDVVAQTALRAMGDEQVDAITAEYLALRF